VRNFSFCHNIQVPFGDALTCPLENIAKRIKKGFKRLQTDETYRLHHIAASAKYIASGIIYWCGSSSIVSAACLKKVRIKSEMGRIEFHTVPRCWFYVVGHGITTTITVDIKLPLQSPTEEVIRDSIFNAAKGTALEIILSRIKHDE